MELYTFLACAFKLCFPRAALGQQLIALAETDLRDVPAPHAIPAVQCVADSFRDQWRHGVSHDQAPDPIGLTNPRTLIHTASFAEEDQ